MRNHVMVEPSQRRSDASANVGRILAAAREIFAENGASTTLSQIAAAAGVAEATLYRHFPNRQTLAAAVYENIYETEVKPATLALPDTAEPEAFIDALALLEEAMVEQRTLLASIDDLAGLTAQLIMNDRQLFEGAIKKAQAMGNLRPDVSADEVAVFVAMITSTSATMGHSKEQRRRYLHLTIEALTPLSRRPFASPQ